MNQEKPFYLAKGVQGSVQIMRQAVGVLWREEYSCFNVTGLSYFVLQALGSVVLGG